ncbi:hypothetical protein RHSIM_Rhsim05G0171500 [Rhododendron simsii]|uniref:Uncharacterized protein n=1 Tax=Rhododendron simsii TaxID=118357 RepID=A0A834H057_RHOSS|nr:hypothetical protein RHSIM_Rhsim05G0171500 [Rhododendron simsii]
MRVSLSLPPEWPYMTPVQQDDGPNPAAPIAYKEVFSETDYFRTVFRRRRCLLGDRGLLMKNVLGLSMKNLHALLMKNQISLLTSNGDSIPSFSFHSTCVLKKTDRGKIENEGGDEDEVCSQSLSLLVQDLVLWWLVLQMVVSPSALE